MKITVITVVINAEKTIQSNLTSVACQTFPNLRHLIVDGGSTDRTREIFLRHKHHRVSWISQEDSGIYDAMNKALDFVYPDEFVLFINGDDRLTHPNILQEVASQWSGAEVICGKIGWLDIDGQYIKPYGSAPHFSTLRRGMVAHHQGVLAKRNVFQLLGKFETRYQIAADYDWILRLATANIPVQWLEKEIAQVRLGGISDRKRMRSTWERWKIVCHHYSANDIFWAARESLLRDSLIGILRITMNFFMSTLRH